MPDTVVWEVICKCGYRALGIKSSGWSRPIPLPPTVCCECGRVLTVKKGT